MQIRPAFANCNQPERQAYRSIGTRIIPSSENVVMKILDLKAFLPSKDFSVSRRFYRELGFAENFANADVAEFEIGGFRFLLQDRYVAEWAGNFMMQMMCDDVTEWWNKLEREGFRERYPTIILKEPKVQPWGLRVMFLSDPSGVLWHFVDRNSI
jgi:uncharacterized glyoxalase superfamily protein PhnB